MKYGYGDYELGSLIKKYKKKNNKIIITFLDGTKKEEPLTNIKEEEILNKMLKQAIERNDNIKWEEILEKRKFSKNNIIKDILFEIIGISLPYIHEYTGEISLFLGGTMGIFLIVDSLFYKLSSNEIKELKKYDIYLDVKDEIEKNKKENININNLDNYSLKDLEEIRQNLINSKSKDDNFKKLVK